MANQRVQVRPLDESATLRPTARPQDSYYQPALQQTMAQPPNESALSLASSLASVRPQLQEIIDKNHKLYIDEQQAAAERRLQGLTFDEAKKLQDQGQLAEHDNPWYRAALSKAYGIREAQNFRDHAARAYNGTPSGGVEAFDPNKENFDAWYQRSVGSRLNEMGGDRMREAGFASVAREFRTALASQEIKRVSANDADARNSAIIENLRSVFDKSDVKSLGPNMFKAIDEAAKAFGRDKREITDTFVAWSLAQAKQYGGYEKLKQLAEYKQGGVSLFSNPAHAAKLASALDYARAEDGKRSVEADTEMYHKLQADIDAGDFSSVRKGIEAIRARHGQHVISPEQEVTYVDRARAKFEAIQERQRKEDVKFQIKKYDDAQRESFYAEAHGLARNGRLGTLVGPSEFTSADGLTKKSMSEDELRRVGMERARREIMKQTEGMKPADRFMTMVKDLYAKNDMVDEATSRTITSAAAMIDSRTITAISKGEKWGNADKFAEAAEMVDAFARSGSLPLMWKYIKDSNAQEFWRAYLVQRRLGKSVLESATGSHIAREYLGTEEGQRLSFNESEVQSEARRIGGENWQDHVNKLKDLARLYVANGIGDRKEALVQARKEIEASSLEVDGRRYFGMKDASYNLNVGELLTEYKKYLVAAKNEERKAAKLPPLSADNYYIVPTTNQSFYVRPKIGTAEGTVMITPFSYSEMIDWMRQKEADKSDALKEKSRKNMRDILERKKSHWTHGPDPQTVQPWLMPNDPQFRME